MTFTFRLLTCNKVNYSSNAKFFIIRQKKLKSINSLLYYNSSFLLLITQEIEESVKL